MKLFLCVVNGWGKKRTNTSKARRIFWMRNCIIFKRYLLYFFRMDADVCFKRWDCPFHKWPPGAPKVPGIADRRQCRNLDIFFPKSVFICFHWVGGQSINKLEFYPSNFSETSFGSSIRLPSQQTLCRQCFASQMESCVQGYAQKRLGGDGEILGCLGTSLGT